MTRQLKIQHPAKDQVRHIRPRVLILALMVIILMITVGFARTLLVEVSIADCGHRRVNYAGTTWYEKRPYGGGSDLDGSIWGVVRTTDNEPTIRVVSIDSSVQLENNIPEGC